MSAVREKLKELRSRAGFSQAQVAAKMGMKRSSYNNWENGNQLPPLKYLPRLCELYGLDSPLDLLPKRPTYTDLIAIQSTPVDSRSYEDKVALAFGGSILASSPQLDPEELVANLSIRKAREVENRFQFIRDLDLMDRFGGMLEGDAITELMKGFNPDDGGSHDDDLLFAYHSMKPAGRDMILHVLSATFAAEHQDFVNPHCVGDTLDRLKTAREEVKASAAGEPE